MKRSFAMFIIPFIVFTYASFVLFQKACDYGMSNQAVKKISFNHRAHLITYSTKKAQGDAACVQCHTYDKKGRFQGIPTVSVCTSCHLRAGTPGAKAYMKQQLAKYGSLKKIPETIPLPKKIFNNFKDTDKPWQSFARQPDLVYFSHKVVTTARFFDGRLKVRCGSCHGDKANSMTTAKIKGKMLMGQCEDCHRALHISNKCAVCHD